MTNSTKIRGANTPLNGLLMLVLSMLFGLSGQAQSVTGYNIGFLGGQDVVNFSSEDSIYFLFNGGRVISSGQTQIIKDQVDIAAGFPYPVAYFSQTFSEDFFVSKGYFPDYIQLNWKLLTRGENITRFLLFRKPLGSKGDSLLVATVASDAFSFRDEVVEGGVLYKYTLFAQGVSDGLRIPFINYIESTGFAFPVGTATGRITFEGGTAVEGVTVLAETDGNLKGRSVYLNGTDAYLRLPFRARHDELSIHKGFTFQAWTKFESDGVLFSYGDDASLSYDGDSLYFKVGTVTARMEYANPVDSFFHVTVRLDATKALLSIYARSNSQQVDSVHVAAESISANKLELFYFGRDKDGSFYGGFLDEMRLWNRPLSVSEINRDYSRYISGTENGLSGYWSVDTGVSDEFYDFSRQGGFDFNENHGQLIRATWSEETPDQSQLAYRGVTDREGNYIIKGFPFETSGSLYTFTPIKDIHRFEPNQQLRYVGDGAYIFNEVDFNDVSSFPVSGIVTYRNTPFPVENVNILVDGRPALDAEGKLIATDIKGEFTIDVPIGFHSIKLNLTGHGFENDGRFPAPDSEGNPTLFNFQEPLAGLHLIDTTLRRMAGKVVGGPVQGEKLLGFGLSKNNIGMSRITLRPDKLADLTFSESDSLVTVDEEYFSNSVNFNVRDIYINPDPTTGEFVAMLPPEQYVVTGVSSTNYVFNDSYKVAINLKSVGQGHSVLQDTVLAIVEGDTLLGYPPFNEVRFDSLFAVSKADTVFIVALDTFRFDHRQDFILRLTPFIEVTNQAGNELFGDSIYVRKDKLTGQIQNIDLFNDGEYTFGHPIFKQLNTYDFFIRLYEEYEDESGSFDQVAVKDGWLNIRNDLSVTNETRINLNTKGSARYRFQAGFPQINKDDLASENSYTHLMNITAFSGNEGSIQTIWREQNPFRGIIIGGVPTGNNFVTTGPNQVLAILRDPPGSESYTFMTAGSSTTFSSAWSESNNNAVEVSTTSHYGSEVTTFTGTGVGAIAGTIDEQSVTKDLSLGFSSEQAWVSENTQVTTTTFEETVSTSGSGDFVGADGDVFVGFSTNIVYGKSQDIDIIPTSTCTENCGDYESEGFRIGRADGFRLNPEFATYFALSQFTLESVIIPGLVQVRNSFLNYVEDTSSVVPTDGPVYLSLVPRDDPRFGLDNNDPVWESLASRAIGEGPSYVIKVPNGFTLSNDTVLYFNQQIEEWKYWLAQNERVKLESKQNLQNVTFDGGSSIERSSSTTRSTESTRTFEYMVSGSAGFEFSTEFKLFGAKGGADISIGEVYSNTKGETDLSAEERSTTYGYVLADGNPGDTYTVDIADSRDGFGPVFSVRGGQTSCPYEDELVTKYYKPGETINVKTAQREKPAISVEQNVVSGVPDNRAAVFSLILQNNSETEDEATFNLDLVDGTNPFGAIIKVDGASLGNGLAFTIAAGATLPITLTVEKGREDISDYEDVGLVLTSQCDGNLSDEISISAFFQPGCSDVILEGPVDLWVLNTRAVKEDTISVMIEEYDLNYENFKRIEFQSKPSSSSQWTTRMNFYNPLMVSEEEFATLQEPKQFITGPEIVFQFDMNDLPDRKYDLRAVTKCELGPGVEVETPSEIHRGTKDTQRPTLFGTPQPADGILSANDEISIQFTEEIEAALINKLNLSVRGVLNNTPLTNTSSVSFDGTNDFVKVENGLEMDGSFTVFFWLRRQSYDREVVLFSKGDLAENSFEFGFTEGNKLFVDFSGDRIESSITFPNPGVTAWEYYAVAYNKSLGTVSAYRNGEYILEGAEVVGDFSGSGTLNLGRSVAGKDRHFIGNMHELRIWDRFLTLSDVAANFGLTLSGDEIGLVGYWPLDEAIGNIAFDKARSRHASVFAEWLVEPQGYSYSFDGVNDYVELNTASTVVIGPEQDFTIEFWFKAQAAQKAMTLFSNGRGDGGTQFGKTENLWSIGFNTDDRLTIQTDGKSLTIDDAEEKLLDDNWHHLALSVNRTGNINIWIDKEMRASVSSSGFGGLLGSRMWLGARGYRTGSNTATQDQFFDGHIDEFRIWNTFRRRSQIELYWINRLSGDEPGLVAYYPWELFEIQSGVNFLNPSLKDITSDNLASGVGGGFVDGATTANIRLPRPVAQIDFDFAVNKDKIILTPAESFKALIERTILEISLVSVEDLYENRLASPVSWTAFVDRNKVKWDRSLMELSKPLYGPLSFTVDIINRGGLEEEFSIQNLPPWLTASTESGIVSPIGTVAIRFTVNEGINPGYYFEDIYLASSSGFDEKLSIDLKVKAPGPDWSVNPSDFQFSMNVIAQLEINHIVSTDVNDQLAAFVNGEPRGVANLTYIPSLDQYQTYLDIYSNSSAGDTIEFRVWDGDKGIEYRNASPTVTFKSDIVLGTPVQPVLVEVGDTSLQRVEFRPGWNWVSFNINSSALTNASGLLNQLNPAARDQIKGRDPNSVSVYTQGIGWLGPLSKFNLGEMYLFKLANGGSAEIVGGLANPATQISISRGWNYLGFIPRFNMTADEALAFLGPSTGDILKSQSSFAVYQEGSGWIGSLYNLEPGRGYLFWSQKVGTLVYPEVSALSGGRYQVSELITTTMELNRNMYADNLSLIGTVEDGDKDHILAVFHKGELRGLIEPIQIGSEFVYFLTVHGDMETDELNFMSINRISGHQILLAEKVQFTSHAVIGTIDKPFRLTRTTDKFDNQVLVYPNPFNDRTSVDIPKTIVMPRVSITDISGREVCQVAVTDIGFVWRAELTNQVISKPGVYFIRIENESNQVIKLIKE